MVFGLEYFINGNIGALDLKNEICIRVKMSINIL